MVIAAMRSTSSSRLSRGGEFGAAAERGVTGGPATTWYLASGATHSRFDLFYIIFNLGTRDADVPISFLRPVGQQLVDWRGLVSAGLHSARGPSPRAGFR